MTAKNNVIRLCAWCKRARSGDKWVFIPIPEQTDVRSITHGICEECANKEWKAPNGHSQTSVLKLGGK